MAQTSENNNAKAWTMALLGWLLPGLGHVLQGRVIRGVLMGATVIVVFVVGAMLGGHLYSLLDGGEGLLSKVFGFCNLGSGLLYFGARLLGVAVEERAELATSEYGNVFFMVAGLLNYLILLDAFDVGLRRKH